MSQIIAKHVFFVHFCTLLAFKILALCCQVAKLSDLYQNPNMQKKYRRLGAANAQRHFNQNKYIKIIIKCFI